MAKKGYKINGQPRADNPASVQYQTKQLSLVTTLQEMLSQADKKGDSDLRMILERQIYSAKRGNLDAAKFLLDRAFGSPTQTVNNLNPPVTAIQVNIIRSK
jgi:hypothetical protein